jgi:hypothetical protein
MIERLEPPPLRTRMLHFSAESLASLKERARQELLAAGDTAGAAALTRFQALSSLAWRCITRARRSAPEQETTCRAAINNRARLRPALPAEYFGNSIDAVSTETPVRASMLLERGRHGWAAAAVGRAVAAHDDEAIRAGVAAWMAKPVVYTRRWYDPHGTMVGSSPRFDMYGCDFGWGRPLAARSGKANKVDGRVSLYPWREGGDSVDAEVSLTPEHMRRSSRTRSSGQPCRWGESFDVSPLFQPFRWPPPHSVTGLPAPSGARHIRRCSWQARHIPMAAWLLSPPLNVE